MTGVEYSSCQVYTDVPAHLAKDDSRRIAGHFRIHDGKKVTVSGTREGRPACLDGAHAEMVPLSA